MKFSTVVQGKRAERPYLFRYKGKDVPVVLVPLAAIEEMDAEGEAIAASKLRGEEPKAGHPVYESARMIAILARGVMDPDSPIDRRESTFDGGPAQIARELGAESIGSLYEQHRAWQDECSPSLRAQTPEQMLVLLDRLIEEDEHDPFAFLRPSPQTRLTCTRIMARRLRSSRERSTSDGTPPGGSPTEGSASPSKPEPERSPSSPASPDAGPPSKSSPSPTETTDP